MMASTMQLEFTQAMTDFKIMFPDMDDDVIEAVLRANQGTVDATIDQLLAMSTDNQNEKLRQEIEKVESGNTPQKKAQKKSQTPTKQRLTKIDPNDDSLPLCIRRNWMPKMLRPLPPGFLRLPAQTEPKLHDLNVDLDDENIALFLQNEEFMAELRWNDEFLNTLDNDAISSTKSKRNDDDDADFKERLKNMGKNSRKKFALLSRMFGIQSKTDTQNMASNSRLLHDDPSDDEEQRPGTPHPKL